MWWSPFILPQPRPYLLEWLEATSSPVLALGVARTSSPWPWLASPHRRRRQYMPQGKAEARLRTGANGSPDMDRQKAFAKAGFGDGGGLSKDRNSIALLLLLYTLQGIPLGLAVSVPLLLQSKHISYKQQAMFSLVSWPFSLKVLWAPVVDALYWPSFGRRKSWLVPIQLLCAALMILLSFRVEALLGEGDEPPAVLALTACFLVLHFCMATQDIAVDGWALTMLSVENRAYASTCNTMGQNAGFFLSYVVFLVLHSPSFCNSWLRRPETHADVGVVQLGDFMLFWGLIFLASTLWVWFWKPEKAPEMEESVREVEPLSAVVDTYHDMWKVLQLPNVLSLSVMLLTARPAFAAFDAMSHLKLVDKGFGEDTIAMFALFLVPVNMLWPLALQERHRSYPLRTYMTCYPYRVLVALCGMLVVMSCPNIKQESSSHYGYTWLVLAIMVIGTIPSTTMFISIMGFFNAVADDRIGGSYMTLLNTITNLSSVWPSTLSLMLVDTMTFKQCVDSPTSAPIGIDNATAAAIPASNCPSGQTEQVWLDGYYVQTLLGVLWGVGWYWLCAPHLKRLQALPTTAWKIPQTTSKGQD
eukprot:g28351.t1